VNDAEKTNFLLQTSNLLMSTAIGDRLEITFAADHFRAELPSKVALCLTVKGVVTVEVPSLTLPVRGVPKLIEDLSSMHDVAEFLLRWLAGQKVS
jgi:hypothetical protein